ncbi:hypothetical protein D3C80_1468550 [compost metagenome]
MIAVRCKMMVNQKSIVVYRQFVVQVFGLRNQKRTNVFSDIFGNGFPRSRMTSNFYGNSRQVNHGGVGKRIQNRIVDKLVVILRREQIQIWFYHFFQTRCRIQIDSFLNADFDRMIDMSAEITEKAVWGNDQRTVTE